MLYWIATVIGLLIAVKLTGAIAREIADARAYRRIMRENDWDTYLGRR